MANTVITSLPGSTSVQVTELENNSCSVALTHSSPEGRNYASATIYTREELRAIADSLYLLDNPEDPQGV